MCKTEFQFEYGLGGMIIKVLTYSNDPDTQKFELRNEGIRSWNMADSLVHFYEFDKNGGITTGIVTICDNNIYYDYDYLGVSIRDSWEYIDPDTYVLIIGVWNDSTWKHKIHTAKFIRE